MRKLISVMLLCLFCLVFASCRGFVESETKEIVNVYHEVLADGRTKVVIEYSDELSEPNVFYLPAGQDGNGIKNVNSFLSDDGKSTIVELIFTDKNAKPIKVAIPNGISITGVTSKFNLFEKDKFNHNVNVVSGCMEEECSKILKKFFREKR